MAEVLIWRMQFTDTNPLGEFVSGDRLEWYYETTTTLPHAGLHDGIIVKKYYPTTLPAFTPAAMDALADWLDTGSDWSESAGEQSCTLTNNDQSSFLYTDYSFTAGREYTFDYEVTSTASFSKAGIRFYVTDNTNAIITGFPFKIIDLAVHGNFSGSWTFIAPSGATRIRAVAAQTGTGSGTYTINAFTNETAAQPEITAGFNEISEGADISFVNFQSYLTEESLAASGLCNSTTNVAFSRLTNSFPYLYAITFPDHPSCAVNPPTCDLQFVGVPVVRQATGESTADGEIDLRVTSSNDIQYRVGNDFAFDDGTGTDVVGGLIELSGLFPGSYRIYVRDELNCFANVLVTVGFTEGYGPINRLEFDVQTGNTTLHTAKIEITKFDYSSSVTEVKGANIAFNRTLKGEASENKFETILATEAVLGLTSETNFQFVSLFTNNPEEYRLAFYRDATLKGIYKVLPQQYEEDYKAPPYYVKVVATCGLGLLKTFAFIQDDGQPFNGSIKAIELIAFILNKLKLNIHIRVAINMYATGMSTGAANDPLDQAYVDTDTYYIHEQNPNCEYVLRQLLEPFGARILQENAVWNILRVEELVDDYDYREFDEEGVYVSNSNYDPIVEIIPPSVTVTGTFLSDRNHYLKVCPGFGKVRVFYKLGLRENIFENGDFRLKSTFVPGYGYVPQMDTFGWQLVNSDYTLYQSFEYIDGGANVAWKITGDSTITTNTGNAYFQSDTYSVKMGSANSLKFKLRYKVPAPYAYGLTAQVVPIPYQKVRFKVTYGSYYLRSDGSWTTSDNTIIIYVTEYDKFLESEITAPQPDAGATSGYNLNIRIYHSYIYHSDFTTFNGLRARVTYSAGSQVLPTGSRTEVQTSLSALVDPNLNYYELEENTDAESEPTIIRPTDYHATNNPRQWIRKTRLVKNILTNFSSPFWLDKVSCEFLTNGERSADTIIREIPAESRNSSVMEKEVTHGSYQSLITTIPQFGLNLNTGAGSLTLTTTNILSADILYAGYFRNSSGTGWETWVRDGIAEETSLHAILLQQLAGQYKRSWRKLTGSLYSNARAFTFLDVFAMTNDSDRKYLPVSGSIDELNNRFNGEFLELVDGATSGGSTGGGEAPFNSAFSTAFGASYD